MRIQEQIENDLKEAIQNRYNVKKDALKVIFSELQRAKTKILPDEDTIFILQNLKKWEVDRLKASGQERSESYYLEILNSYIPENLQIELNEETIKDWIIENIDFSQYKNKFASIKTVKNSLGPGADGNIIKKIISKL